MLIYRVIGLLVTWPVACLTCSGTYQVCALYVNYTGIIEMCLEHHTYVIDEEYGYLIQYDLIRNSIYIFIKYSTGFRLKINCFTIDLYKFLAGTYYLLFYKLNIIMTIFWIWG